MFKVITQIKAFDEGISHADTSAFTNAAYSIQGDNQVNIEYGTIIFKDLNMTIVPYSKSGN